MRRERKRKERKGGKAKERAMVVDDRSINTYFNTDRLLNTTTRVNCPNSDLSAVRIWTSAARTSPGPSKGFISSFRAAFYVPFVYHYHC
jgi:hypothetical protein